MFSSLPLPGTPVSAWVPNFTPVGLFGSSRRTARESFKAISVAVPAIAESGKQAVLKGLSRWCFKEPAHSGFVGPAERVPGQNPIVIINGILNTHQHVMEIAELVSTAFGGRRVDYTVNPTNGLAADVLQVILARSHSELPPTLCLVNNILSRLDETNEDVILIAHSEGGYLLKQIEAYLSEEDRQRIRVYTLGSAHLIEDKSFQAVRNFISWTDPVPTLLNPGKAIRSAISSSEDVEFIGSKVAIPGVSHLFSSSDYQEALKKIVALES